MCCLSQKAWTQPRKVRHLLSKNQCVGAEGEMFYFLRAVWRRQHCRAERPTLRETRRVRAALPNSSFPFLLFPRAPTALRYFWKLTTASVFKIQTSASRPRMQPQLFWPLMPSRAPCPTRLSLSSVSSTALGKGTWGWASPGDKEEGHTPQHAALRFSGLGASSPPPCKRKASVGRSMFCQHFSCHSHLQVNP